MHLGNKKEKEFFFSSKYLFNCIIMSNLFRVNVIMLNYGNFYDV